MTFVFRLTMQDIPVWYTRLLHISIVVIPKYTSLHGQICGYSHFYHSY